MYTMLQNYTMYKMYILYKMYAVLQNIHNVHNVTKRTQCTQCKTFLSLSVLMQLKYFFCFQFELIRARPYLFVLYQ